MSGCLKQIGCLVVLAVLGIGAWLSRELWWERVTGRPAATERAWTPVDPSAAPEVRRRVEALEQRSGVVFATLTPAEVGALIFGQAGGRMPPQVNDVETAISGDRLSVRALVDLSELRGVEGLGPVAALLSSRQRITITGRPFVVERGRGAFDVDELTVGGIEVPALAVGTILRQLDRSAQPSGRSGTSISFSLPPYVGDIRVARGRVTLYKNTP